MIEQQTKLARLKEQIKNYRRSSADKPTQKKLFSDMINTFIETYKTKSNSTIKPINREH